MFEIIEVSDLIENAFSSVSFPILIRTPSVIDLKNEWNSAMCLLGSPPGRTNPPIALAPLHQEVRCSVHSCAHSTARSAVHSFQLLEGLAYFLLGWRPLPVGDSCPQMMNFERRNFGLQ